MADPSLEGQRTPAGAGQQGTGELDLMMVIINSSKTLY